MLLQQDAQVICVQHRVLRGFVQALASERKNVAERADADQEVAVEGTDRADGGGIVLKGVACFRLYGGTARQILRKYLLGSDRRRSGTASAVRRGEGLVQVKVDDVKAISPGRAVPMMAFILAPS